MPGAVTVASQLPANAGAAVLEAARGAFAQGFVAVALIGAVLMLVAAAMMAAITSGAKRAEGAVPFSRPRLACLEVSPVRDIGSVSKFRRPFDVKTEPVTTDARRG
jgi:hypothetical protein